MRTVTIALPDVLYSDLEREAAALATLDESRYSPADWAADCVTSELPPEDCRVFPIPA
ncbi:MAG TPA: hypothetical protein VHX13_02070 [Acidobacteriaceae bacterium]|jgi:hypothetical protein|nr:hypothetical protein [Acidobacteriaceae bacterium]